MTIWQKISMIPSAMLLIWKNFLFGPHGNGRPKIGLFGLGAMALFYVVYIYFQTRNMGVSLNMFATCFVAFIWAFGLPSAIYLIDLKNKYGNQKVKSNS